MSERVQQAFTFEYLISGSDEVNTATVYAYDLAEAMLGFHINHQLESQRKRDGYRILSIKQSPRPSSWLASELPANPDIFKCSLPAAVEQKHHALLRRHGYFFRNEEAVAR